MKHNELPIIGRENNLRFWFLQTFDQLKGHENNFDFALYVVLTLRSARSIRQRSHCQHTRNYDRRKSPSACHNGI
jgi:hypothetical protein